MEHNTKNNCSACGTGPVNHTLAFFISVIDEIIFRVENVFPKVPPGSRWERFIDRVGAFLSDTCAFFGIITFNKTDVEKAPIGRSKIIWEEAVRRNIPMEQILVFGHPTDNYRAKINGEYHYFNSLPIPPRFKRSGYTWVDDKLTLARVLEKANIPSPKTREVRNLKEAKEAFDLLQKPVILKPKSGSRGRHTTTNINTIEELEKAFKLAREISITNVLQEHLFGSVYRATVIDGKLVGFYRADQPQVVGDGVKKVGELIEEKNRTKRERVSDVVINDDLKNFIGRSGCTLESVLPAGQSLTLSAKTGRMYGSYTKEMFPEVHPKMHEIFAKAGKLCEGAVLGFDLITTDPIRDPHEVRWGIIECNSLPFIDLHLFALEGQPIDLSKNVWDLWKE